MDIKKININKSELTYNIASALDAGYLYAGIATPSTNPGTPDGNVFYIAGEGTYTNFSNLVIDTNQFGILKWNGTWSKQVLELGDSGGNMILDWNTNAATTRKQVLSKYRKQGIQISYKDPNKGWVNEQYIGTTFTDTEWAKDSNWEKLPNQKQIANVEKKLLYEELFNNEYFDENAYYDFSLKNIGDNVVLDEIYTKDIYKNFYCCTFPCVDGDTFRIKLSSEYAPRGNYAFISSEGQILEIDKSSITIDNLIITAPSSAKLLVCNIQKNKVVSLVKILSNIVNLENKQLQSSKDLTSSIGRLNTIFNYERRLPEYSLVGYYINKSGLCVVDAGYKTYCIKVQNGYKIKLNIADTSISVPLLGYSFFQIEKDSKPSSSNLISDNLLEYSDKTFFTDEIITAPVVTDDKDLYLCISTVYSNSDYSISIQENTWQNQINAIKGYTDNNLIFEKVLNYRINWDSGKVESARNMFYSKPLLLLKNQTIKVTTGGGEVAVISETDSDASFYKPILTYNSASISTFTYKADSDVYIAISGDYKSTTVELITDNIFRDEFNCIESRLKSSYIGGVIDFTSYQNNTDKIINTEDWNVVNGKSAVIPVVCGCKVLVETEKNPTEVTFLQSLLTASNLVFADGYINKVIKVKPYTRIILDAPKDAKFFYVRSMPRQPDAAGTYNGIQIGYYRKNSNGSNVIRMAASNSSVSDKLVADLICTGENDQDTIQLAVNLLGRQTRWNQEIRDGGTFGEIHFASGTYMIDKFYDTEEGDDGPSYAIRVPFNSYITFKGDCIHKVILKLEKEFIDTLSDDGLYAIIGGTFGSWTSCMSINFFVENLTISLKSNKKPIICIDGWWTGRMSVYNCHILGPTNNRGMSAENIQLGVMNCIGIRGLQGSNNGIRTEICNVLVQGLGVGYACSGEHLFVYRSAGIGNTYTFTFNQFKRSMGGAQAHPITLMHCTDEVAANYPLFGDNPDGQTVVMINYEMEKYETNFSLGGNYAKETTPGQWGGMIDYTIQPFNIYNHQYGNSSLTQFWEKGSGLKFVSRNNLHGTVVSTATRNSWSKANAANLGQCVIDSDLGKPIWWTGEEWIDNNGTIV